MQSILPALVLLVTVLIVLNKLTDNGVIAALLKPSVYWRRRTWIRRYSKHSAYGLTEPMAAVALLMTAVARSNGNMSREQRKYIVNVFECEFLLDDSRSGALVTSSVKILSRVTEASLDAAKVLQPCLEKFTTEKAISTLQWMHDLAMSDGVINSGQHKLLNQVYAVFDQRFNLKLLYNSSTN